MRNLNPFTRFFLSERAMIGLIVLNAVLIFLEESGINSGLVFALDYACTLAFAVEMAVKLGHYGWHDYWRKGWNRLDGLLVIASLPSLVLWLLPHLSIFDMSILLIFRTLRVFRFIRLFKVFPTFDQIGRNFWKAMKDSTPIFLCFVLLVVIGAMLCCFFFRDLAPEYFATPLDSIYTTFRLCTIEGWYEIPDAIGQEVSPWMAHVVRFYFIGIVIIGGVVGISLVNSVFVDAMVSDNNDSLEAKIDSMQQQLDRLERLLKEKNGQKN